MKTTISAIIGLIAFGLSYLLIGASSSTAKMIGPKYAQRPDFIGLSEDDARSKALIEKMRFRIISRDSESYPLTLDYVTNRINVALENGVVIGAYYG